MNKDMMNIDDFVREKLSGQPEREDPTAWLRMKALLDKEMPEKAVPFYFRWGKPMAFLGAALLLAGLCVGGFEITKAIRAKNEAADVANTSRKTKISSAASGSTVSYSSSSTNNSSSTNHHINHSDSDKDIPEINKPNSKSNSAPHRTGGLEEQKAEQLGKKSQVSVASSVNSDASINDDNNKDVTKTASTAQMAENKGTSREMDNTSIAVSSKKSAADSAIALKSSLSNNVKPKSQPKGKRNNLDQYNAAIKKPAHPSNNVNVGEKMDDKKSVARLVKPSRTNDNWASTAQAAKSVANPKGYSKDSMPYTNIVQKETLSKKFPRTVTTLVDTQGKGKIALPEIASTDLLVDSKETMIAKNQDVKSNEQSKKENEYASSLNQRDARDLKKDSSASRDASSLVLKDAKKSKKKSFWEILNWPEATASAKKDLKNAQFYAGFSGGLNYSISKSNNFQGVQFGPTGELVFNKNWSLFGAIRYFNRSGGKKTINDSYSKEVSNGIIDSTKGANYFFTVLTDSSSRYFNFSTVHSFELPLTVRYTISKFYLMTGINLAYSLPVNVELVQKEYKNLNAHAISTNTTKPILKESAPVLSTSDFGSRFGIGYILGAGYQIAPAWQTDIRLVNTFWDNAKGGGANKLSKDFYKLPSVQISIGYQFNRSRVKPTYGPTSIAP